MSLAYVEVGQNLSRLTLLFMLKARRMKNTTEPNQVSCTHIFNFSLEVRGRGGGLVAAASLPQEQKVLQVGILPSAIIG